MPRTTSLILGMAMLSALTFAGDGLSAQQSGDTRTRLDSSLPIEINADALEVRQQDNLAVFSGNVDAVQGTIRFQADQLQVHYRPRSEGDDGIGGAIARLDAFGQVRITSPNETAEGQTGVYDVDNRLVTLNGDVVLTQGDNVLRGQRLVINLESGVTMLDGAANQGGNGRVKAIFVPEKSEEKQ